MQGQKGIFITGTGTDVGKTYAAALLVKALRQAGVDTGYYKAAVSGADSLEESDAGYVNRVAQIGQREDTLLSYLYSQAVSPHLAARLEGRPVEMEQVARDFARVAETYEFVVMEGSGGIVCPIRYDASQKILLEDIIRMLSLDTVIVADAGLGTINAAVLTAEYLRGKGIGVRGFLVNRYTGDVMQEDNVKMIEALTGLPVLAKLEPGARELRLEDGPLEILLGGKR